MLAVWTTFTEASEGRNRGDTVWNGILTLAWTWESTTHGDGEHVTEHVPVAQAIPADWSTESIRAVPVLDALLASTTDAARTPSRAAVVTMFSVNHARLSSRIMIRISASKGSMAVNSRTEVPRSSAACARAVAALGVPGTTKNR
jgi:hypothetical protein